MFYETEIVDDFLTIYVEIKTWNIKYLKWKKEYREQKCRK